MENSATFAQTFANAEQRHRHGTEPSLAGASSVHFGRSVECAFPGRPRCVCVSRTVLEGDSKGGQGRSLLRPPPLERSLFFDKALAVYLGCLLSRGKAESPQTGREENKILGIE